MTDPADGLHPITRESFRLIDAEIGGHGFPPAEYLFVRRVIHATADFQFRELLRFSPDAVAGGIAAIRGGAPIVVDVRMVEAGISPALRERAGVTVHCRIDDPAIAAEAKRNSRTRAETAMEFLARAHPTAVFVVGNAPTALAKLAELVASGVARPALVIGVPVGFVGTVAAKEAIMKTAAPYIVAVGRKGGSPAAAALANALLETAI